MITIINSDTGNFQSVINMIKKIGFQSVLTDNYDLISKSKNTSIEGRKLQGKVTNTFVKGEELFKI